ncbi:hypothetical protein Y1Q_0000816 [Alligator mississippiensis]|uniref:Uncharacterized protein n=1 Tax=Alligator mississippiensis TaxID=8496 RepID=A0A151MVX0_ALLMI|nr:hypothetical protein Y1Q_0000816 [Alligator mississippiensis]
MQSWEWGHSVETCAEAVALAGGFELGPVEDEALQVTVRVKVQDVASDKMANKLWPLQGSGVWMLNREEEQPLVETSANLDLPRQLVRKDA